MAHTFLGTWISNAALAELSPRNVFHKQLSPLPLDCSEHRNCHVLFRRRFTVTEDFRDARIFLSADDYYKLYINGRFVAQGPAPSYHFRYNYNEVDLTPYLTAGENVIAVHTLYQGLINRVWQSGDQRHGFICDLVVDGETILSSDESFSVATHTGFTEMGVCGYQTQFLERYDSRAPEVGFERPDFDDSSWVSATVCKHDDHTLTPQQSAMLTFEEISPVTVQTHGNRLLYDFGSNYVGYLWVKACGHGGDRVILRCAQELNEDGTLRHNLRANCAYEEEWILSDGECELSQYDYKAFRYAELELHEGVTVTAVHMQVRHYPFTLLADMSPAYASDPALRKIWELCVHTQKYGVQEVIQDCMEREKGFYLGDGCYTALTNMVLTHDDSMVRKLIDDAFATSFITDTLVTCMDCSFMQEIAEYPLILVYLVLWHYRLTKDRAYLLENYGKVASLLEAYRRDYEHDGLLRDLDKWCVVEWPMNFRHGYDVDIREGKVCETAHVSINAYYLGAIRVTNHMASILELPPYRDEAPVEEAFYRAFYDPAKDLFRDSEESEHISLVGNSFVYGFGLYRDGSTKQNILSLLDTHGIASLSFFCAFPILMGLCRDRETNRLRDALTHPDAWLRMLREDATTTFEGWGKDTKWNTSLFHLTMSYAALFLSDTDTAALFA